MKPGRAVAALLLLAPLASSAPVTRAPTPDALAASLQAFDELGIQAGILAQRRGQTDAVRRYGRVLERDRRLSEARAAATARGEGLRLGPAEPSAEDRAELLRLEGVPDSRFDREFLLAAARAQRRGAARLAEARRSTPDRRLAELLGRILPVVEQDRELAERLSEKTHGAGRSYGG